MDSEIHENKIKKDLNNIAKQEYNFDKEKKEIEFKNKVKKIDKKEKKEIIKMINQKISMNEMGHMLQLIIIKDFRFSHLSNSIENNTYFRLNKKESILFEDFPFNDIKQTIEKYFKENEKLSCYNNFNFNNHIALYDTWQLNFKLVNID